MPRSAGESRRNTFAASYEGGADAVPQDSPAAPERRSSKRSSSVETHTFNADVLQTAIELARQRGGSNPTDYLVYNADGSITVANNPQR